MNKKEVEMIIWNIKRLEFLNKDRDKHIILDHETYLKSFYHTKGFIEGLKWALNANDRHDETYGKWNGKDKYMIK
jgi:hypothetical protein